MLCNKQVVALVREVRFVPVTNIFLSSGSLLGSKSIAYFFFKFVSGAKYMLAKCKIYAIFLLRLLSSQYIQRSVLLSSCLSGILRSRSHPGTVDIRAPWWHLGSAVHTLTVWNMNAPYESLHLKLAVTCFTAWQLLYLRRQSVRSNLIFAPFIFSPNIRFFCLWKLLLMQWAAILACLLPYPPQSSL